MLNANMQQAPAPGAEMAAGVPAPSLEKAIDAAEVLLKLAGVAGSVGMDAEAATNFNWLLCKLLKGFEAEAYADGTSDSGILRAYLTATTDVIERALTADGTLTIAQLALLRTAAPKHYFRREYTASQRSGDDAFEGELYQMMRQLETSPPALEAYSTAEAMDENCVYGVNELKRMASLADSELLDYVNLGRANLVTHFESLAIPMLFDGQRLRAGLEAAAAFVAVVGSEGGARARSPDDLAAADQVPPRGARSLAAVERRSLVSTRPTSRLTGGGGEALTREHSPHQQAHWRRWRGAHS